MCSLYSWNVNGIRAVQKKGLLDWIATAQPDVLGLQETKAMPDQLDSELLAPPGYHAYFASAERKGYSGVALYSKAEPRAVHLGLGIPEYDIEGRTIIAEYDDFVFITAYFPNGSRDHSRVPYKMAYKEAFLALTERYRADGRPVVFCGDVNTAHQPIDLARPKENERTTGFLPQERAWIDKIVDMGYIDTYRHLHPGEEGAYSWWSNRSGAREKNVGWRIDYFFITPDLLPRVAGAAIHPAILGSDHCPISLDLHQG
jgi:exodeoxyribonuclease III